MATEVWLADQTPPPTETMRAAVEQAVRDYFDGWFDGDPERMARALHPSLAKRSLAQDADRTLFLSSITADEMVADTAAGSGIARGRQGRRYEIRIDEISAGIAAVTVHSDAYVEFLHLVHAPDGWRIINALWRYADGRGPLA
ncbi:MAG TPA: nuclear transport factor 2 family protein [Methylomirabilota bacterium]|nr:nuclear transport factor 2 family protein [Methylomirabilota bacterium]